MASERAVQFSGVYVAVTTPFAEDGSLSRERFIEHCSWLVASGVAGLVPSGSLGEYEALDDQERAWLFGAAFEAAGGRVKVVPGVSGRSGVEARRWAERAAELGCPAVMCLPPTSHAPTAAEVLAHFQEVAKAGLPIVAYNNPYSTRVDLTPELLATLEEVPEVVAVKEFSQDARRVARIREVAPGLEILCGCDDALAESALLGATGWIAGFANAFPVESVELFDRCRAGRWEEAVELYRTMLPLLRWDADPRFVQAIKVAQDAVGRYGGPVRLPRLPLSERDAAELRRASESLGRGAS